MSYCDQNLTLPVTMAFTDDGDGERTWMYAAAPEYGEIARAAVHPGESYVKENGTWRDWTEALNAMEDNEDAIDNYAIKAFFRE